MYSLHHHWPGSEDWAEGGQGPGSNQRTYQKIRTEIQVWNSRKFDGTFSYEITKPFCRN